MFAPMNPMAERIRVQNERPQSERRTASEALRNLLNIRRPKDAPKSR